MKKQYKIKRADSLTHHGILGMKWGKRNGPPYPLSPGQHSDSEKKAGWRKSLKSKIETEIKKDWKSDEKGYGRMFLETWGKNIGTAVVTGLSSAAVSAAGMDFAASIIADYGSMMMRSNDIEMVARMGHKYAKSKGVI